MRLIAAHQLIQKLRTLKIQPIDGLIQQKQLGPQGKCRYQVGFFQVAGRQLLEQNIGVPFKVKAFDQTGSIWQRYAIRCRRISQIFSKSEIY